MNLVCQVLIWKNFGIGVVKKFQSSSLIKSLDVTNSVGKILGKFWKTNAKMLSSKDLNPKLGMNVVCRVLNW